MRRRTLQNSPDARTSTTPVLIASETMSPPPMLFRPRALERRQSLGYTQNVERDL